MNGRWRKRRRTSAPRNHEIEESIEPAEDPPVDDPVNIPEPSGVKRSMTPRTYQRKKRTAEDDPLSFLDDWTTSLEESEPPPDEPESNNAKESKAEEPAKEQVEESAPNDPPPAKRARRPRALKGPTQEETSTKKVLPPRPRAKRTEPPPSVAAEPEKKLSPTIPPVPVASTAATTAGPLVALHKSKPVVAPVKEPSPFRPPEPAKVDTIEDDSSDSDSVEDVPIIGNRFTVHRTETLDKPKPASQQKNSMNPVVRLVKMNDDDIAMVRSTEIARPRLRVGRPARKQSSPPRAVSPVRTVETTVVRRRGRPPKNPNAVKVVRVVQPEPTTSRRDAPSSSALVRPGRSNPPSTFISSELTARRYNVPDTPVNGQVVRSNEFGLRPSIDVSPPEWFERFVIETRQQEMWKVHQLMKMQNELLDAEARKRNVLEKILSALHERYDRQ